MRILVLALAAMAACGSSGPVPFEEYCQRYVKLACDAANHCSCLDNLTRPLCPTYVAAQCQDEVEKDVKAGKKTFDSGRAGECLSALGKIVSDCSLTADAFPEACDTFLVGAVAASGGCTGTDECLPGLYCSNQVCLAEPTESQPCPSSHCASGLFCDSSHVCQRLRDAGASCSDGPACKSGLYCDSKDLTCQTPHGAGFACQGQASACQDSLYCSTAANSCRPVPAVGGDCDDSHERCADGLYCDSAKKCQQRKAAGQTCAQSKECQEGHCTAGICAAGSCPFL